MTTEIQQQLTRLELQHNIQILYAVESGSRALGITFYCFTLTGR